MSKHIRDSSTRDRQSDQLKKNGIQKKFWMPFVVRWGGLVPETNPIELPLAPVGLI